MIRNVPALFAALWVAGCASTQLPAPPTAPLPMATEADAARGRVLLKLKLRDPESARFSLNILKPGAVCGLVNAKNAYGGYAGSEPWLYLPQTGQALLLGEGDSASEKEQVQVLFEKHCGAPQS